MEICYSNTEKLELPSGEEDLKGPRCSGWLLLYSSSTSAPQRPCSLRGQHWPPPPAWGALRQFLCLLLLFPKGLCWNMQLPSLSLAVTHLEWDFVLGGFKWDEISEVSLEKMKFQGLLMVPCALWKSPLWVLLNYTENEALWTTAMLAHEPTWNVQVLPFRKEGERLSIAVCPRVWFRIHLAMLSVQCMVCASLRGRCSTSSHQGAGSSLPGPYGTTDHQIIES